MRYCSTIHFILLGKIGLLGFAALSMSCAHVPTFRPSQPIENVPSLHEGLVLCHEYRMPPASKRPVDLKPFLNCLDELRDRFPAVAASEESFRVFQEEFQLSYHGLNEERWSERLGQELELSVHAVLRALWQVGTPVVTGFERELVIRNFPSTAQRLHAMDWEITNHASFDPQLEKVKAGVASFSGDPRQLTESKESSAQQDAAQTLESAALCERYLRLFSDIRYLAALRRDLQDLVAFQPNHPLAQSIRSKYDARLNAALRETEGLRPKIADGRAKGSFRVLACRNQTHA